VLAHAAVGAVEADGTGRSRKGSAKRPRHERIVGTAGEEAGAAGWTGVITLGSCTVGAGGDGAWGRQLRESPCHDGSAALLVPTAVLKRTCALPHRLLSYHKAVITIKLNGLGKH